MMVKAAVLRQPGKPAPYAESRPLAIETVELAPPATGEIRVRVLAAGLCHSDLSVIDGSRPRPLPVELGPNGDGSRAGGRVVFPFSPACGPCGPCAAGRASLCEPGVAANAAGTL